MLIRYVANPQESRVFYETLLGITALESSPTFVMLKLDNGMMLGLWVASGVQPSAEAAIGGSELAIVIGEPGALDRHAAELAGQGHRMLLAPTDLDFGRSFMIADPDGHRIRFFTPAD